MGVQGERMDRLEQLVQEQGERIARLEEHATAGPGAVLHQPASADVSRETAAPAKKAAPAAKR